MVTALSAFASTFGLIAVFVVLFGAVVTGLMAFAAIQGFGERADNEEYAARHRTPG